MNYLKTKYHLLLWCLLALLPVITLQSCKKDVIMKEPTYEKFIGYLKGTDGKTDSTTLDLHSETSYDVQLQLSKPNTQDVKGSIIYNMELIDDYNKKNGTTFQAFPEDLVTLSENGHVEIKANTLSSNPVKVSIKPSPELGSTVLYIIPLSTKLVVNGIQTKSSDLFLFVHDLSKVPSTDKSTGIKIISCIEVNDTNPLNNLSLKLKNSDKYLVDMVILFSSNVNYDAATGKVKVTHNENVTHLLENRNKYIKPLQDKGMKVILSLLGNHDRSGVANLSEASARLFAQEIKAVCDEYNLDGVFFDDEYSAYQNPPPPGFVTPSNQAAARLVYETKKAMPDKLTMVYVYSRTGNFGGTNAIAESSAGQYVDYALHDYGQSYDLSGRYPDLPKSRWAMSSGEYNIGRWPSTAALNNIRSGGFGAHMIFALDPTRANFKSHQTPALQNVAKILFDDELVINQSQVYSKDW